MNVASSGLAGWSSYQIRHVLIEKPIDNAFAEQLIQLVCPLRIARSSSLGLLHVRDDLLEDNRVGGACCNLFLAAGDGGVIPAQKHIDRGRITSVKEVLQRVADDARDQEVLRNLRSQCVAFLFECVIVHWV